LWSRGDDGSLSKRHNMGAGFPRRVYFAAVAIDAETSKNFVHQISEQNQERSARSSGSDAQKYPRSGRSPDGRPCAAHNRLWQFGGAAVLNVPGTHIMAVDLPSLLDDVGLLVCAPSTAAPPNCSICISSSTTTQPTSTSRSRLGSSATPAS